MGRSHAELTQLALNAVEAREHVEWGLADYAREDHESNGVTARTMASEWGFSESTVNKWMRAATLFAPEHRYPEVSFSHYVIACATDDPVGWIHRAVDAQWSTRDLREHITHAQALDPALAFQTQVNAAIQRVRKLWEEADDATRRSVRERLEAVWEGMRDE
jgi:DNA-binding transcriptional regulator YdaS (Cro superfamily)